MTLSSPRVRRQLHDVLEYIGETEYNDYCEQRDLGQMLPNDRRHVYANALAVGCALFPQEFWYSAEDRREQTCRGDGLLPEGSVVLQLQAPKITRDTPEVVATTTVDVAAGVWHAVLTRRPINGGLSRRNFILSVSVVRDPPTDPLLRGNPQLGVKLRNWWLVGLPKINRRFQVVDPATQRKVIVWLTSNPR